MGFFPNGFLGGEQLSPPKASPVAIFGGAKVMLNVGMYFLPGRRDYEFTARGFIGNYQITQAHCQVGPRYVEYTDYVCTTDAIIPAKVDVVTDWMRNWLANGDSGSAAVTWTAPAHNKMYVTWMVPIA